VGGWGDAVDGSCGLGRQPGRTATSDSRGRLPLQQQQQQQQQQQPHSGPPAPRGDSPRVGRRRRRPCSFAGGGAALACSGAPAPRWPAAAEKTIYLCPARRQPTPKAGPKRPGAGAGTRPGCTAGKASCARAAPPGTRAQAGSVRAHPPCWSQCTPGPAGRPGRATGFVGSGGKGWCCGGGRGVSAVGPDALGLLDLHLEPLALHLPGPGRRRRREGHAAAGHKPGHTICVGIMYPNDPSYMRVSGVLDTALPPRRQQEGLSPIRGRLVA
jgi:hypothetical protein